MVNRRSFLKLLAVLPGGALVPLAEVTPAEARESVILTEGKPGPVIAVDVYSRGAENYFGRGGEEAHRWRTSVDDWRLDFTASGLVVAYRSPLEFHATDTCTVRNARIENALGEVLHRFTSMRDSYYLAAGDTFCLQSIQLNVGP